MRGVGIEGQEEEEGKCPCFIYYWYVRVSVGSVDWIVVVEVLYVAPLLGLTRGSQG